MEVSLISRVECDYCHLLFTQRKSGERFCCEACQRLHEGFSKLDSLDRSRNEKFKYLDQKDIQDKYLTHEGCFIFYVEGMQCSSCVHLIEKIPDYYPLCKEVRVNFGTSVVQVYLKEKAQLSLVALMIEELGYQAQIMSIDDVNGGLSKNKIIESNRQDLKKIAVAGVCAGNIMIFSIGIYAGVNGALLDFFRWASFLLFIPVLTYSAQAFYVGALNSFKYKIFHIDLPIVIALISSFIFSTYNLFVGSNDFYYDSTAGFLFLILSARYLIKKTQQKYLAPAHISSLIKDQIYKLSDGRYVVTDMIKENDILNLESTQSIPVDGVLLSDYALLDTAFFDGESNPKFFSQGQQVYAGYKVISQSIEVKSQTTFSKSKLSSLFQQTIVNILKKNHYLNYSDRLAQKLIMSVTVVSVIYFLFYGYYFSDYYTAFNRVLALIVVACPCALAFGSPLTLAMAYRRAMGLGIALRSPDVFEKLNKIQSVFFDKTGTVTAGKLKVVYHWPDHVDQEMKKIILSLEKISYHPVAFAFRDLWIKNEGLSLYPVDQHQEYFGIGVKGYINNEFYEIKSLPQNTHEDDLGVGLFKNNQCVARFYFEDQIRLDSAGIVDQLQKKNMNVFLLTGDKKSKAMKVADKIGIPSKNVYSDLFPEDKEKIISEHDKSLMIGDGVNDILALSKSQVGIAVQGSSLFALYSSDVLFLKGGLSPLSELFQIKDITNKVLNRNMTIAIVYNFIAGILALLGYINPLWAAILMPASTFIVLISTLWGFRQ